MDRISQSLGHVYKYVCVAIIALMVIIVFLNTTLRYCFNSGIVETEEVLRYLFIWGTFLGITAVYKEKSHIAVTLLTDKFSARFAEQFSFFMNIIVLYALYVLILGSIQYMEASVTTLGQLTGLPFNCIIFASLFAGIAISLMVLREMWDQLRAFGLRRS